MRTAQKLIKAFAIFLASIIILTIFGAIISGVALVGSLIDDEWVWNNDNSEWVSNDFDDESINKLDINVKATSLKIRIDSVMQDDVRIETNNEYIDSWTTDRELHIVERSHGLFGWGGAGEVILYLKKDLQFDHVRIEVGAGALRVDALTAKELSVDLGAGKASLDNLKVSERTKIEGGAGTLAITNSELAQADISVGTGKGDIQAKFVGNSKVDSGVGKLDLELLGKARDYRLDIDKGIGSVTLNNQKLSDGASWGEGKNRIDINSGVGAVEIKISEE